MTSNDCRDATDRSTLGFPSDSDVWSTASAQECVPPLILIGVPTYRRPRGLRRLAQSLEQMHGRAAAGSSQDVGVRYRLRLVVVDNDPDGSARATVDELRPSIDLDIDYRHETRRGIPFARNAVLDAATECTSDFIAFVDDDEIVDTHWLEHLLATLRSHDADVVTGPVVSDLEGDPPAWLVDGGFFDSARHATGTKLHEAWTNNVLFTTAMIRRFDLRFDERLAMTGGSDAHFFRRVADAGATIVWCAEAIVRETVPTSRLDPRWLRRRSWRYGTTAAWIERDLRGRAKSFVPVVGRGLRRFAEGAWLLLRRGWRGPADRLRAAQKMRFGAGLVAGWFGRSYEEYKLREQHESSECAS